MKRKLMAHGTVIRQLACITATISALALAGCKGGTGTGGTTDEDAAVANSSGGAADTNAPSSGGTPAPATTNETDTSSQGDTNSGVPPSPSDTNAPPSSSGSDTNTDSSSGGS